MKKLVKPKTKKEFDDLKGLPPQEAPWPEIEVPGQLEETQQKKVGDVKLNLSDIVNVLMAMLRNKALEEIYPKEKALKIQNIICWLAIGLITIAVMSFAITRCM